MATASGTDVVRALQAAGFPDDQLVTGAAVAYAESGFDTTVVRGEDDGSTSYGVWQINSSHNYPELSGSAWQDLKTNAALAKRVFDSQGWNAWSVHKTSDVTGHARYLAALTPAVAWVTAVAGPVAAAKGAAVAGSVGEAGAVGGGISDVGGGVLGGVAGILKEPLGLVHWLSTPAAWLRIGKVAIGTGLILGGAYLLVRVQVLEPVGQKVASVAVGVVAPEAKAAGKAASTAKKAAPATAPASGSRPASGGSSGSAAGGGASSAGSSSAAGSAAGKA